jgi:hypothetical protein
LSYFEFAGKEVKNMKRKLVFGTFMAVVLAVIVLAGGAAPALAADTTHVDHCNAGAGVIMDVPGHPTVDFIAFHYDWGDFGVRDAIGLWVAPEGFPGVFMPAAEYSDTAKSADWNKMLFAGLPTVVTQVKPWQIQVCRIGKTVIVSWTVPLVAPAENWGFLGLGTTPAVTIPPGCLVLHGYDGLQTGTLVIGTSTQDYTFLWAHATLLCPMWHYCGPVGEAEVPLPRVFVSNTVTTISP